MYAGTNPFAPVINTVFPKKRSHGSATEVILFRSSSRMRCLFASTKTLASLAVLEFTRSSKSQRVPLNCLEINPRLAAHALGHRLDELHVTHARFETGFRLSSVAHCTNEVFLDSPLPHIFWWNRCILQFLRSASPDHYFVRSEIVFESTFASKHLKSVRPAELRHAAPL